jgi:hypothetical protein
VRKLTTVATIIAILVGGTAICVSSAVYCNNNPTAKLCQEAPAECDEDDWEEGDSDCDGLEGPNSVDTDDFDYKKPKPPAPKPNTGTKPRK